MGLEVGKVVVLPSLYTYLIAKKSSLTRSLDAIYKLGEAPERGPTRIVP